MDQTISFSDTLHMYLYGEKTELLTPSSFNVLNDKNRVLYREEWDEQLSATVSDAIGIPFVASTFLWGHVFHRFTYRVAEDPSFYGCFHFSFEPEKGRKCFDTSHWLFRKYPSGSLRLNIHELSREGQFKHRYYVKQAEKCLLEDNRYRLLTITGELEQNQNRY